MWYGVSSIAARFLSYLLTPYLTSELLVGAYGEMNLVYSLLPFLNVLFMYGLETAYFRFVQKKGNELEVYSTITISLIISTVIFTGLMLLFRNSFASLISLKNHPEYIVWCAFIIAFDALSTIAFARLRLEGRPIKYVITKLAGILVYIGIAVFFLTICPALVKKDPNGFVSVFYNEKKA